MEKPQDGTQDSLTRSEADSQTMGTDTPLLVTGVGMGLATMLKKVHMWSVC